MARRKRAHEQRIAAEREKQRKLEAEQALRRLADLRSVCADLPVPPPASAAASDGDGERGQEQPVPSALRRVLELDQVSPCAMKKYGCLLVHLQ
jgi:hypothetical protein